MDFGRFGSAGAPDIAIDLGTANTLVYVPGKGIIIDEPSVVAIEQSNGTQRVMAVGADAKILIGKTPEHIRTYRPLTDGVISDLEIAEEMIKHFIRKATGQPSILSRSPEIVICVPSGATSVERRAIRAAALNAGGREVWLVEEPMTRTASAVATMTRPSTPIAATLGPLDRINVFRQSIASTSEGSAFPSLSLSDASTSDCQLPMSDQPMLTGTTETRSLSSITA